jgi:hypothetical protein
MHSNRIDPYRIESNQTDADKIEKKAPMNPDEYLHKDYTS